MMHRTSPPGWTIATAQWLLCLLVLLTATIACANESQAPPDLADDPRMTDAVRAVRRAAPSVVNIHSVKISYDDATVFGSREGRKVNGMGTGIVIDPRGYIVTNHHVVADVESMRCTLMDGSTYDGTTIAVDPERDLAIVKIEPTRSLPVMPLGTSSDLMLCETVIAVGNAFGYEHTVTKGIISALHRDVEVNETQAYENLIQTDASINPGNSGGPLLNMRGEVIGINVAIRAGAQRIGFAIPIDDARIAIADLMDVERLSHTTHGLLTKDVKTGDEQELIVRGCEESSPAMAAGFQEGDVITGVAGREITDRVDLERFLLDREVGENVEVTVQRDGQEQMLTLSLAAADIDPTRMVAETTKREEPTGTGQDAAWRILGLKLKAASDDAVTGTNYAGGLEVLSVREGSPAAMTGIQSGDVLVGLHDWATVKMGDVDWVLKHPDLSSFSPLRFYVLGNRGKGQKTLSGRLTLASGK